MARLRALRSQPLHSGWQRLQGEAWRGWPSHLLAPPVTGASGRAEGELPSLTCQFQWHKGHSVIRDGPGPGGATTGGLGLSCTPWRSSPHALNSGLESVSLERARGRPEEP